VSDDGPRSGVSSEPLVCPSCATAYPPDERFCPSCRVPLVYRAGEDAEQRPVTERHQRARKIKPQLAEGELVRVAGARNQAEAEFIQGLLLEEGVPSLLRRTAGFDVPDFLAAGPRDILVPHSGAATAREILLEAELIDDRPSEPVVVPLRLAIGLLVALAVGALVIWLTFVVLR
jgi:uncharacterized protein YbaR (Trm112 family)